MLPRRRDWGSDDAGRKGGDYFGARQAALDLARSDTGREPAGAGAARSAPARD